MFTIPILDLVNGEIKIREVEKKKRDHYHAEHVRPPPCFVPKTSDEATASFMKKEFHLEHLGLKIDDKRFVWLYVYVSKNFYMDISNRDDQLDYLRVKIDRLGPWLWSYAEREDLRSELEKKDAL